MCPALIIAVQYGFYSSNMLLLKNVNYRVDTIKQNLMDERLNGPLSSE